MPALPAWDSRSSFSYTGSVATGTKIVFGANHVENVSAEDYSALLKSFRGRTVNIGTSRTDPPKDSVGEWLKQNVTKRAIASYVGPILIAEGYAERGHGPEMEFK